VNKVILIGRLTHDAELRYTPQGRPVASLRLATNEYAGSDESGQAREHTEYHSVTVWGPSAEAAAKHLAKGRQVLVEGALRTRSWDDQESGQRRQRTEVLAARVEYLGGPSRNGRPAVTPAEAAVADGDVDAADIPF